MVNVTIKDGDYLNEENYEDMKEKYLNTEIPVKEIMKEYNLTRFSWKKIYDRIVAETGFTRTNAREAKYYHITPAGRYVVGKRVNGKQVYFGTYKTLEIAEQIISKLKKVNWDINELDRIRGEVLYEC